MSDIEEQDWFEKAVELADAYAEAEACAQGECFTKLIDKMNARIDADKARDQLVKHLQVMQD